MWISVHSASFPLAGCPKSDPLIVPLPVTLSRVALRVTGNGTMSGSLFGHPASGKEAEWTEIHISNLEKGRVTDHWAIIDWVEMFQQFGLMPGIRSIEI